MKQASGRGMVLAVLAAALMHLLLFAAVQPTAGFGTDGFSPPRTSYLFVAHEGMASAGETVRLVQSPVVFSLPTSMGFSSALSGKDVQTRLSFVQPVETEQFLPVEPGSLAAGERLDPMRWMISNAGEGDPGLPSIGSASKPIRLAARRVTLAPELKTRLLGGVVLPPELNRPVAVPWEVRASVSVSEQGSVEHVFLESPLESKALNRQVLQLLYGLRFKPGNALEGGIEIYSPEAEMRK